MKLGDRVFCTAYIKPSKNHYLIRNDDEFPECVYWECGDSEGLEVEDFHSCNRFKTVDAKFSGVYVGETTLCIRLNAEYWSDGYSCGYQTFCDEPQKFAVVYYANNRKRLVPIDRLAGYCIDQKEKELECHG